MWRRRGSSRARAGLAGMIGVLLRLVARVTPMGLRNALSPATQALLRRLMGANAKASGERPAEISTRHGPRPRGVLATRSDSDRVDLVLLLGLPVPVRDELVTQMLGMRASTGGFLPVFVTDSDDFRVFRERQAIFEYLPERTEWRQRFDGLAWSDYFDRRVHGLLEHYRPRQVINLSQASARNGTDLDYLYPLLRDGA